jgi:hypothetical protein
MTVFKWRQGMLWMVRNRMLHDFVGCLGLLFRLMYLDSHVPRVLKSVSVRT